MAGSGDEKELREAAGPELAGALRFLGRVSEADKASMLRSLDIYCAPNIGGESFGIILTEAMSAGTPVVASDLDAFRRVLDGGHRGGADPGRRRARPGPVAVRGAGRPGPPGRAVRAGPAGGRRLRLAGGGRDRGQGLRDRGRRRSAGGGGGGLSRSASNSAR